MTASLTVPPQPQPEALSGSPRIVCWGETLWDVYPDGRRLGGSAANVAVHAAQLGARVTLVTRVGADEAGDAARAALFERGLSLDHVQVDRTAPTGSVRVELTDGQVRYSIAEQAAWDRIELCDSLAEVMAEAAVVVYGTLAQRTPLGSTQLRQALALAERAERVCDLNIRQPFASSAAIDVALASATVVKLNLDEAHTLSRMYEVDDPIAWVLARGVRLVAFTQDERGAELCSADARLSFAAEPLSGTTVDPVGAGDAFTAALAVHLTAGSPLQRMGLAASLYAAAVVSRSGATPVVPDSVIERARP